MYIGIDLGGTNIAAGVVDENGKIINSDSIPTLAQRSHSEIIKDMAMICKKVTKDAGLSLKDIKAIGVGAPGHIDTEKGLVVRSENFADFSNIPLKEELQKLTGIPVNIENDANAAAFGEYVATGAESSSFVFITLGTGVGGGAVIDGKIYRGFNNAGAEFGHMILAMDGELCTCGNKGCWEAYASVTALIRQTKEAMEKHPDSLMKKIADEEGKINGRTSFLAASKGDKAAQEVVDNYIKYVATGIASMVNIFQPETLVIGGGISKEGDTLLLPIKKIVDKMDYNKYEPKVDIKIAKLFNDAGIIGAALAAK